jgi:hypothetical protein
MSFQASERHEERLVIAGQVVRVTTYHIGEAWTSRVDNIDPGSVIGRGHGKTLVEARRAAVAQATVKLEQSSARKRVLDEMRESVDRLHERMRKE